MQEVRLNRGGDIELSPIINRKGSTPLLKVEACGVCATDRKALHRPPASMQLPRVLGHECCGTLLADLGSLTKGMKVALWPALSCGTCIFCSSNRPQLCENLQLFGLHLDGGFSHTLSVPAHLWERIIVLPLPPALSFPEAVFAEPLGCVLHGLGKGQVTPGRIMIYGGGLMGRLAAQASSHLWPEAEVVVYDSNPERRNSPPVDHLMISAPVAANLVFIACSSADAVYSALDLLEPGGTIILFSGLPDSVKQLAIDHNHLHRREQTLTGSYGCTPQDMAEAIDLLAHGQVSVDELITKSLPLSELGEELARTTDHNDYKTIITP